MVEVAFGGDVGPTHGREVFDQRARRLGAEHLDQFLGWCGEVGIRCVTAWVASADNMRRRDSAEVERTLAEPGETPLDDISGLLLRQVKTRAALNAAEAGNIAEVLPKYLGARLFAALVDAAREGAAALR